MTHQEIMTQIKHKLTPYNITWKYIEHKVASNKTWLTCMPTQRPCTFHRMCESGPQPPHTPLHSQSYNYSHFKGWMGTVHLPPQKTSKVKTLKQNYLIHSMPINTEGILCYHQQPVHSKHSVVLHNQYYNAAPSKALLPTCQRQQPSAWRESKSTKPSGFSKCQGHNQTINDWQRSSSKKRRINNTLRNLKIECNKLAITLKCFPEQ